MTIEEYMKCLKHYRPRLTRQQYRTLKGQALSGNIEGAAKGLLKLMKKLEVETTC